MRTKFIDLSHTVEHGMITYEGLPGPVISDHLSREASRQHYAPGTEFYIGKIEMVANTGTYIDAPFHRHADGKDLSELPLTSLANLDGIVIRVAADSSRAIDASHFAGKDLYGKTVLVQTGWSQHWRTDQYFEGHPFLTPDAVQFLIDAKAALVGIDSLNIDSTDDATRPAHTFLLQNDIPVVEHLTGLDQLPDQGFKFFAVPVKIKNFGSFPIRAFAFITE